ncbi:MAG: hypothetical protein ACYCT9_12180 [Leptospirillum sp.]
MLSLKKKELMMEKIADSKCPKSGKILGFWVERSVLLSAQRPGGPEFTWQCTERVCGYSERKLFGR